MELKSWLIATTADTEIQSIEFGFNHLEFVRHPSLESMTWLLKERNSWRWDSEVWPTRFVTAQFRNLTKTSPSLEYDPNVTSVYGKSTETDRESFATLHQARENHN